MNRSNASGPNALPLDSPGLSGLKETPDQQVESAISSGVNPSLGKQASESETAISMGSQTEFSEAEFSQTHPQHSHHLNHGHHSSHGRHRHVHDDESIRRIVNRLSRIEGHVRGLKRMVQDQENCPDVLIQVAAVRGALDKVARLILDEHLTQCVLRAAEQGNIEAEIEALQAALNRFLP